MKTLVVDSWALMAWINGEQPAYAEVSQILDRAAAGRLNLLMSAINVGEVYYQLAKRRDITGKNSAGVFKQRLPALPITVHIPDMNDVWHAADQKRLYRISYADAFAASLGLQRNAPVLTGDPEFKSVANLQLHWLERHPN